jgi:hypothetical protein
MIILMIIAGAYFDTICKIAIVGLPYLYINIKCQLGIYSKTVFHYMCFVFILLRINRVHRVNELNQTISETIKA